MPIDEVLCHEILQGLLPGQWPLLHRPSLIGLLAGIFVISLWPTTSFDKPLRFSLSLHGSPVTSPQ